MARSWPPWLQVRTCAAIASAPNCQYQPRSPGCSCIGEVSCCHSRRARTTSPSWPTPGVLNSIATLVINTVTPEACIRVVWSRHLTVRVADPPAPVGLSLRNTACCRRKTIAIRRAVRLREGGGSTDRRR